MSQISGVAYGDNGNIRSFVYDALHRLTADRLATKDDATIASIGYGYDDNGNVTSKTSAGFTGSTANVYTYDWANRLTSWNNGTSTTGYGYDDSGNRTRVGADVYTYDARDELTSDGKNTYEYTARGTRSKQNDVVSMSDALGQAISQGGAQSYAYDGRVLAVWGEVQGVRAVGRSGCAATRSVVQGCWPREASRSSMGMYRVSRSGRLSVWPATQLSTPASRLYRP